MSQAFKKLTDWPISMPLVDNTIKVSGSHFTPADLAAIRGLLENEGYAYLIDIPDDFPYLEELSKFGKPIPHYENELVKDIKPDSQIDAEISALTMKKLPPHTEWHESPGIPPRYVALWCIRASSGEGGETTLADGYRFLKEFSTQDQKLMRERQYEWCGVSNNSGGPPSAGMRHPILEPHPDGLIMRYSSQFLQRADGDDLVSRYIDGGLSFFAAERLPIPISRNSVLLWDNWRMMHARNAFNDPERHLRRILIAI